VQVGDLVKVAVKGLRAPIGSLALVTKVQPHTDARGVTYQYWARMTKSGHQYWFRLEQLEVINASR
jgi:hypothetical protein